MISDFVSFFDDALQDFRVLVDTLADDEECRLDVSLRQHLEKTRRVFRMRPIIESHGDVLAINVALAVGDFRRSVRRNVNGRR